MKWLRLFLLACSAIAIVSCGGNSNTEGKPKILTTTSMVYDLVKNLVGDTAEVELLIASGLDPHSYTAKQSDLEKIANADFIVYNGLHLEGKLTDVLEKKDNSFAISGGLNHDDLISHEEHLHDPHIWLDIEVWKSWKDTLFYIGCEIWTIVVFFKSVL